MIGPRLPLLIAFTLAALLALVNVSAYSQGAVTSGATITVASTSSAALALSSTSPMAAISGGILQVDFRQGNGSNRSLQTSYASGGVTVGADLMQMKDVFRVTNASSQCLMLSVYVSSGSPGNLTAIYGRLPTDPLPGTQLGSALGAQTANRVNLGAAGSGKEQMLADFHWLASNSTAAGNFTVKVTGLQTATCP